MQSHSNSTSPNHRSFADFTSITSVHQSVQASISASHQRHSGNQISGYLTSHSMSSAASFFVRAGQKMHPATSKRKRKCAHHDSQETDTLTMNTNFCDAVRLNPPLPALSFTRLTSSYQQPSSDSHSTNKVKVILRIFHPTTGKGSDATLFLLIDQWRQQVMVHDPSSFGCYYTSSIRKPGTVASKTYAFDGIYTEENSLSELCAASLAETIQAVVNGFDGCLFCFGNVCLDNSLTMLGSDSSPSELGIIPCAIAWLFRLIDEQKEKTGARFSVRISALQMYGRDEKLKDLLADVENISENDTGGTSPGIYLKDDPISGTQLENQNELRAPTAEKAAYYLDAALAARNFTDSEDDARLSHILFTLHVYQYRVQKNGARIGVTGGRSRLHLISLGSGRSSKESHISLSEITTSCDDRTENSSNGKTVCSAPTFSSLANMLLLLLNGQRQISLCADSKLFQLLRDVMGSLMSPCCMIAQVSSNIQHYNDSVQVIQLASKIQRLRRRKVHMISGAVSSDDSASCDSFGVRRASRAIPLVSSGYSRNSVVGSISSDPDYSSSSEQSCCDTVIFKGSAAATNFSKRLRNARKSDNNNNHLFHPVSENCLEQDITYEMIYSKSSDEIIYQLAQPEQSSSSLIAKRSNKQFTKLSTVWPRTAAKNAIETLSTQKEQWVDGPKVFDYAKLHNVKSGLAVDSITKSSTKLAAMIEADCKAQIVNLIDNPTYDKDICSVSETSLTNACFSAVKESTTATSCANAIITTSSNIFPMVDKETQSEETYESESSTTTTSSYSTLDRQSFRILSDISEKNELDNASVDSDNKNNKTPQIVENENEENNVLDKIELLSLPPPITNMNNVSSYSCDYRLENKTTYSTVNNIAQSTKKHHRPHVAYPNSNLLVNYAVPDGIVNNCTISTSMCSQNPFVTDWIQKHSVTSSKVVANLNHNTVINDATLCFAYKESAPYIQSSAFDTFLPQNSILQSPASQHLNFSFPNTSLHTQCAPIDLNNTTLSTKKYSQTKLTDCKTRTDDSVYISRVAEWIKAVSLPRAQSLSPLPKELLDQGCVTTHFVNSNSLDRCPLTSSPPKCHQYLEYCGRSVPANSAFSEMESEIERLWYAADTQANFESSSLSSYQPHVQTVNTSLDNSMHSKLCASLPRQKYSPTQHSTKYHNNNCHTLATSTSGKSHHRDKNASDVNEFNVLPVYRSEVCEAHSLVPGKPPLPAKLVTITTSKQPSKQQIALENSNLKLFGKASLFTRSSKVSLANSCKNDDTVQKEKHQHSPKLSHHIRKSSVPQSSKLKDMGYTTQEQLQKFRPTYAFVQATNLEVNNEIIPHTKSHTTLTHTKDKRHSLSSSPSGSSHSSNENKLSNLLKAATQNYNMLANCALAETSTVATQVTPVATPSKHKNDKLTCKEKNKEYIDLSAGKDKKVKDYSKCKLGFLSAPLFGKHKEKDKKAKEKSHAEIVAEPMTAVNKGTSTTHHGSLSNSSKKLSKIVAAIQQQQLQQQSGEFSCSFLEVDKQIHHQHQHQLFTRILSPYSTVTQPRQSVYSSSGHGSDCSSLYGLKAARDGGEIRRGGYHGGGGGTSSGYESVLRDSGASSHNDSTSESSVNGVVKATVAIAQKSESSSSSSKRSQSAPPVSGETSESTQSPVSVKRMSPKLSVSSAIVTHTACDEFALQFILNEIEEVKRQIQYEKIHELMAQQDILKQQLIETKNALLLKPGSWSFDMFISEQMDPDDSSFIEALEKETMILQKRVNACKSHIMIITCFDVHKLLSTSL